MCARFVCHSSWAEVARALGLSGVSVRRQAGPSYNIAPGREVSAVLSAPDGLWLDACRWGSLPRWARDDKRKMINARAETVAKLPSFRDAFRSGRCLIIADGFYEWRDKRPYYFRMRTGTPFAMAGIAGAWRSPGGDEALTAAVITTAANELMAPIHERMPVIVRAGDIEQWLDNRRFDPKGLLRAMAPYESADMEMYEVAPLVNRPQADGPECVRAREDMLS